jgi:GAF domain
MSVRYNLDRESFQSLLASAFAVQESGINAQSRSALAEVQRLIATAPDVDQALHLIAEGARKVAHATGIAIALLKADQLVHRAGSGSAANYVGREIKAVLSVSVRSKAHSEILRVEDAQTDPRIEAAICRQFGARSLLILPIYREQTVAGAFEVLFSEAHTFEDREVRMYRLLAGLIEKAMLRARAPSPKRSDAADPTPVPRAIQQTTSEIRRFSGDVRSAPEPTSKPWIDHVFRATETLTVELPDMGPPARAASIVHPSKGAPFCQLRWNVPAAAVGLALLVVTWVVSWNAYDHRAASPVDGPTLRITNAVLQRPPLVLRKRSHPSMAQIVRGETQDTNAPGSAFRVRVGENEIDYIADDVTIRRFTTKPTLRQIQTWNKEVTIGEDVTVRYFRYKPAAVSQTRPVSATGQSVEH